MHFAEGLENTPLTQDLAKNQKYGFSFNTGVKLRRILAIS